MQQCSIARNLKRKAIERWHTLSVGRPYLTVAEAKRYCTATAASSNVVRLACYYGYGIHAEDEFVCDVSLDRDHS